MSDYVKVGRTADFADLIGTGVQVDGRAVCVARAGNTFYAFDDRCTHAESLLSGGDIEDNEIVCPLHGARFDIRTGDAVTLPAVKPVRTHDVKIVDDDVWIRLSDAARP